MRIFSHTHKYQLLLAVFALFVLFGGVAEAQVMPKLNIGFDKTESVEDVAVTLELIALITVLSLAPSFIILMTCFTRIIIVLNFLRRAMGTQQTPPNQLLMGFSLILTFFVMEPTFTKINDEALQPYLAKEINHKVALEKAKQPVRDYMFKHVHEKALALMVKASHSPMPNNPDDIGFFTLIPAFVLSELKTAFIIGFLVYIPFLVIDMVVASVLMSMGMMMLPPIMISMPFKLILFVIVDGWSIVVQQLLHTLR
ncbi:MAG: flagellar type III secretion system pore protein FliP [Fibrobacteria bacterium]|nr:flagellar type III secretion system pore protein FliP [Fibrobacteria bacterium]